MSCSSVPHDEDRAFQREVDAYLTEYGVEFQRLYSASLEAEWASNTHIVEGDDTNATRTRAANESLAAFTGSSANIETARRYARQSERLTALQRRELQTILFKAGGNPQTARDLVKQRIAAETAQTEKLYGFQYRLEGRDVSTNDLDEMLRTETDLARRRAAWEASKDVGPVLRDGLVQLRELRNGTVRALGFRDFFAYMASEYGMTTDDLVALIGRINVELRPLYRELHTYMRHELAERYGEPVPDLIPAHWLPNRWGQEWSSLVEVPGYDLDGALAAKSKEWVIEQAERFYVSLGFPKLPATFWERSSLYPLAADADFKKNNHASAWHMDLGGDVRSLMSVQPNTEWYETTHHELGHVYYYLSYSNLDVPFVLREGANRAYHEAMGSLMGLAAMQPRFIAAVGLPTGDTQPDPMQLLLKEALNYVVFIPWSTGTMFQFEKELYADGLAPERWNARWWELAAKYQGIAPPAPRDERWCDAATKTHVNDDPAAYYDYALSYVLLFQLHDFIARNVLKEDVRDTNYFGRREVGEYLASMMRLGASVDWREMLKWKTGHDLSARAMVDYFEPLQGWLEEQNKGRTHTLPGV
ncbi:MAG: M2 family metallopeptidase [Planctomycetota bacterium]